MGKKITYKEATKRLKARKDIVLCEKEFLGWKKKSKFYDLVAKEYFWSIPYDVHKHKIVHPKRRQEKRKKTNLTRFGVPHATQSQKIKDKSKQTCLEKYGKEFFFQTDEKKEKSKKTCLEKYGVDHHMKDSACKEKIKTVMLEKYGKENPQQVPDIKNKTKKTLMDRYGKEYLQQIPEFKEKTINTCLERYSVTSPLASKEIREKGKKTILKKYNVIHQMHSQEVKNKIKNTCLDRYGVTHWTKTKEFMEKINKKRIEGTTIYIRDWLEEQNNPKPGITRINQVFVGKTEIEEEILNNYLQDFRDYKSKLEKYTEELLEVFHYNKKPKDLFNIYKPDFKLSNRIFVNVDGLYWHSELRKDKKYHFLLREEFEKSGLRIFQFREDEIYQKSEIVKSIINNAIQKTKNKIGARKCTIIKVTQKLATKFLNENHLMGTINAKHIGLQYNNKIISMLSYKVFSKKKIFVIERFCSKINTCVTGGFSKLLNHIEKNIISPEIAEIHNWVDLRYGTGEHLLNKDFKKVKETQGWKWTDGKRTYNRLRCRANMNNSGLTEKEEAKNLKLYKIYDAGQRLWVKSISNIKN